MPDLGPRSFPVSILDRANSRADGTEADALHGVIERAQRAEESGYRRFWVAEHHAVPGIAGSTPTVLMAAVAARTRRIRVGSGGVMLPNHQPLVVAEQAATLEALHPGRIDLGIGRSVGFTAGIRAALRTGKDAAARFPDDLAELLAYLEGTGPLTARPFNRAATPVFVLAGGRGMTFAAQAGLGVVVGGPSLFPRDGALAHAGIAGYRAAFRPSSWFAEPQVIVSVPVAVAGTRQAARDLLVPEAWATAQSRTTGEFPPLQNLAQVTAASMTAQQKRLMRENLAHTIHGTPEQVRDRVHTLMDFTGADELLVTGGMSDAAGRADSDRWVAELFAS